MGSLPRSSVGPVSDQSVGQDNANERRRRRRRFVAAIATLVIFGAGYAIYRQGRPAVVAPGLSPFAWVRQQSEHAVPGNQLGKQFEPLGQQLADEEREARQIAARPSEARNKSGRDRVVAGGEDDRD